MSSLAGKVAVVTGGSSGIGTACVHALAQAGAAVTIGFHSGEERAAQLLRALPGDGHGVFRIPLADHAAHESLAGHITSKFGRLDVLVNSAGFTRRIAHADLASLPPELFNEILATNAGGSYSITRALMPLLRESPDAVVANISSVAAFTGSGSNIAYCAAKAAMDTVAQSMARAFGPVRFLNISPAAVDTDFVAGRSRDELRSKAAATPLGRVVTPEDVAQAVLAGVCHLRTATGVRLVIDGGYTL